MADGRFWSFVFRPADSDAESALITASGASYDVPRLAAVIIEIFRRDDDQGTLWSIFFSVADVLEMPLALRSLFAVSNRTDECESRAQQGFQIVEGNIALVKNVLTVDTAFYPPREPGQPAELTMGRLLTMSSDLWNPPPGTAVSASTVSTSRSNLPAFDPRYLTLQCAPDLACPDSELKGRILGVSPGRHDVEFGAQPGRVALSHVLYPDLETLLGKESVSLGTWLGHYSGWPDDPKPETRPFRFGRRSVFGPPSYRFVDIELVGFRAPLVASGRLVEALNFHQRERGRNTPKHFLYKAAAPKVVIEMLRYGRMQGVDVPPPFRDDDFMPQHELLVRLVVGRVDDDTCQARDAALFVPAIFVDNPWSKAVGRQLQGFPKMLAQFRAGDDALGMDGRRRKDPHDLVPLHEITGVDLLGGLGDAARPDELLTIDCPDASDGSADEFVAPDVTTFLGNIAARRSPWEQFDFIQGEFRRTFARFVLGQRFGGFRVIQVSPVDDTPLPRAWIPGRYTLSNVRVAFPSGVATLRLKRPAHAPEKWTNLLDDLRDSPDPLAFATGDWYRVKCSMELEFDDGLDW